jgi:hypothetical protein
MCCNLFAEAFAMNATSDASRRSLGDIVARWWHRISSNRAGAQELGNFDASELQHIANDVGCDVTELRTLAGRWPESADLLQRRMSALHLHSQELSSEQPQLVNDLKKHCSLCAMKGQCEHDLDKRPNDPVWQRYCPNTMTLLAVSKAQSDPSDTRKTGQ